MTTRRGRTGQQWPGVDRSYLGERSTADDDLRGDMYGKGMTYPEIAASMCLSTQRVKQIESRAREKLRDGLIAMAEADPILAEVLDFLLAEY